MKQFYMARLTKSLILMNFIALYLSSFSFFLFQYILFSGRVRDKHHDVFETPRKKNKDINIKSEGNVSQVSPTENNHSTGHEITTNKSMLPKDTFTTIGNKTDGKSSKQDEVGINIDNQEKCHDAEKETENITAIRQIESMMGRNYSDFMRSLASKYKEE